MQTAFLELIEAIKYYDSTKDYKFMTYYENFLKQIIRQYLNYSHLIRVLQNMNNLFYRYKYFLTFYKTDHVGLLPLIKKL